LLQPTVTLPSAWRVAAPFTLKLKICACHRLASILQHGLLDTILFKSLILPNQAEAVGGPLLPMLCAAPRGQGHSSLHRLHLLLSDLGHVRPALALAAAQISAPLHSYSGTIWISHLTSLSLSFLVSKVGIIIRVSTL